MLALAEAVPRVGHHTPEENISKLGKYFTTHLSRDPRSPTLNLWLSLASDLHLSPSASVVLVWRTLARSVSPRYQEMRGAGLLFLVRHTTSSSWFSVTASISPSTVASPYCRLTDSGATSTVSLAPGRWSLRFIHKLEQLRSWRRLIIILKLKFQMKNSTLVGSNTDIAVEEPSYTKFVSQALNHTK